MYLFFLFFFIFLSTSLIFLILLQPGKEFNRQVHLHSKNNIQFFHKTGSKSFMTNIIAVFSCLFLFISIILCNINNRKIDPTFMLESNMQDGIEEKILNKQEPNSDIPH